MSKLIYEVDITYYSNDDVDGYILLGILVSQFNIFSLYAFLVKRRNFHCITFLFEMIIFYEKHYIPNFLLIEHLFKQIKTHLYIYNHIQNFES